MPKTKQPAIKQPKTVTEEPKDDALTKVLKDFNASWEYCKGSYHDRWMDNYKLYHGERVKRGYEGITDTFVPMVFGTIETLASALFGAKPKFNFLAPHTKPDQKTDILNSLLDFYWDKDQWSIKVINTGRNMLSLGNGIDYFYWDGDRPRMINIPLRDFIIDPTATSMENARYMGRRYLTTITELEEFEIVDIDNPVETPNLETGEIDITYQMKKKYKNLDQLKKSTSSSSDSPKGAQTGDENTDKQEKDLFYGSTLGSDAEDQVEVIELWYEDKTISIVDRKATIEDTENYYKAKARANGEEFPKGIMPFAGARDYTDESLFYAKGEIDFIGDEQELLNDITNQNIDAVTFVLNPMYTLDPKYATLLATVENLPGAVYPFEAGTMQRIEMGNVPQDAFNERQNIKNEIRETTASNEIVKGVGATGGKQTATEINAQVAGASSRINLKITQIENEYFHRMARVVFAMIKLYVTEPMAVRIVGKDGAKWEEFDPAEFSSGEYEPRVQLDIEIENQKAEASANAKEMMAAFLNDPDVNQIELKKLVLAKGFQLDPDEVETLMQPNPMQGMMPGMPGDPMAGGMPPVPGADQMLGAMPPQDPNDVSDIPSDVAMALPPDATPEELALIREAIASQGQMA